MQPNDSQIRGQRNWGSKKGKMMGNKQFYTHSNRKSQMKFDKNTGTDVTHINNNFSSLMQGGNPKLVHMHLNLNFFKLKPCPQNSSHNHKNCPYYHNTKDRKRAGDFYSGEICPFVEKNQDCPYGDECTMSHNRVEQLVFIIFGLS